MPTTRARTPLHPEITALRAELEASRAELAQLRNRLHLRDRELEKLKFELARLKRRQFGRSSECADRAARAGDRGDGRSAARHACCRAPTFARVIIVIFLPCGTSAVAGGSPA